jgi:hypothetical protein
MIPKKNITAVMPEWGGVGTDNMKEGIPLFFYNKITYKYDGDGSDECAITDFDESNIDCDAIAFKSPIGVLSMMSIRNLCNYDPADRMDLVSQKLVFELVIGNENNEATRYTSFVINLDGQITHDDGNNVLVW